MQTPRPIDRVLVTGATGRTGRHVAAAAAARGLTPVALARDGTHAQTLLPGTQIAVGDLEDPGSLAAAVPDVDAVIFTHGFGAGQRPDSAERIDYGGVANVLSALGGRRPRIVLVSTFFITHREHYVNDGPQHALDWKRRSERLIRLSGAPRTIVRPGWLDTGPASHHVTIEQGDTTDASISRELLSTVLLVEALLSDQAAGKTFEAFSGPGPATRDWNGLLARAEPDQPGALDAVKDAANMPLDAEPSTVKSDLTAVRASSLKS